MASSSDEQPAGPAADAQGRSAIDPSENVKALNEANSKRQDDLRVAADRLNEEKIVGIRREMKLTAKYERLLALKEAARLDAIRKVDVDATNTNATVQRSIADALAKTVVDTAAAQATSIRAEVDPIRKDIADLRQSQWQGVGAKEQTVETRESGSERRASSTNIGWWIFGAIAAAGVLGGLFLTFLGIALGAVYFLSQNK